MTIWWEVEEALEAIIEDYIRVNHLISLFQDDKARITGLEKGGHREGVTLELGSGPGNFTRMVRTKVQGEIVCLDYSTEMIPVAAKNNKVNRVSFIRAVFEYLPLRERSINYAVAAYALRDSTDKPRTYSEIGNVLGENGRLTVIDIGKPDHPIIRGFFSVYMRFIVPIIAGLATGYGYRNPWSVLYKTYDLLPMNQGLLGLMTRSIGDTEMWELSFGGLIVAVAEKTSTD